MVTAFLASSTGVVGWAILIICLLMVLADRSAEADKMRTQIKREKMRDERTKREWEKRKQK